MNKSHQKHVAHFLHVGKTGGTAVKSALQPHLEAGRFSIRLHSHDVTLAHIPRGERVFFFLRDPETRFVSGFYSRQRQGRPRYNVPWTPEEKKAFFRFATANDLAKALSSEDFQIREHAAAAMKAIAHVRRTLYHWFIDDTYFQGRLDDILFIGFQEKLANDFEVLKYLLQLSQEVTLPRDEFSANVSPTKIDRSLDPEARLNLNGWYAADHRFVEFCRDTRFRREASANC